jgi:ubiquinone/menaquinone biosynthesis C-methylase UbiE
MNQDVFDSFFKPYSKNVDNVDKISAFWRLSDAIILEVIKREIGPYVTSKSVLLDAGGGTGRWALKINDALGVPVTVIDRSRDMLEKARENIGAANKKEEIALINGDIINMNSIADDTFDHAVSIYSPLSFIYEQDKAVRELYRVLKKGGRLLVMSHGQHNALYSKINNYHSDIDQLRALEEKRMVKWSDHVPNLVTHSKESLESLLAGVGFSPIRTYGIPLYVQPGSEDFDPNNGKVSSISEYLEDLTIFSAVFDLEMRHNSSPTIANRGMNIFTLAQK